MKIALAALLLVISLPSAALAQGVEVPMTPTPTPTAPPKVAPIPTFPEKHDSASTTSGSDATASKVRVDAGGMFGVGVATGNTCTGVAGKYWVSRDIALQFSGGTFPEGNHFREQLDVLFVIGRFEGPEDNYAMPFYVGLGGQASELTKKPAPYNQVDLGLRVPFGMSVVVPDNPVELFFEVAPDFASYRIDKPKTTGAYFVIDGQIGARYYF